MSNLEPNVHNYPNSFYFYKNNNNNNKNNKKKREPKQFLSLNVMSYMAIWQLLIGQKQQIMSFIYDLVLHVGKLNFNGPDSSTLMLCLGSAVTLRFHSFSHWSTLRNLDGSLCLLILYFHP